MPLRIAELVKDVDFVNLVLFAILVSSVIIANTVNTADLVNPVILAILATIVSIANPVLTVLVIEIWILEFICYLLFVIWNLKALSFGFVP